MTELRLGRVDSLCLICWKSRITNS